MAYTHSYRAITKAEVLTLRLEDWQYLFKHFPNSKVTILDTTFEGEEEHYRNRENKRHVNLMRGRTQTDTDPDKFSKSASVPTSSTSEPTDRDVAKKPEVPSNAPAAQLSSFPQYPIKRYSDSEFSESNPSSTQETPTKVPETSTKVPSQESTPTKIVDASTKVPTVGNRALRASYTSIKLLTLEDERLSELSETIEITSLEEKIPSQILEIPIKVHTPEKSSPDKKMPKKQEVAGHSPKISTITSTISLSEKKSMTSEIMAGSLKEIEEPIGLSPTMSDTPTINLKSTEEIMRTNSLFIDNLAVVTDIKEQIDTIDRPSYDDAMIDVEDLMKVSRKPSRESNNSLSATNNKLSSKGSLSDIELNLDRKESVSAILGPRTRSRSFSPDDVLTKESNKAPLSTKYATESAVPKEVSEEKKSKLTSLKEAAKKALTIKQLKDDDEKRDSYTVEQQEAATKELMMRGLGTSDDGLKSSLSIVTPSNSKPKLSDISKLNIKTYIPPAASKRAVLSYKENVTTFEVPLINENPSLLMVRDATEKQNATDASMYAYADDVALKDPKRTESKPDDVGHDHEDIAPVDSGSSNLEKGLKKERKLGD